MKQFRSEYYILIGFICVLLGAILPFLMVMKILESTFFLNFISYGLSIVGLFLGLIGAAFYVRHHRPKHRHPLEPPDNPPDHPQDW